MNPNEFLYYVNLGIIGIAAGGAGYFGALLGHSCVLQSSLFHKRIESPEELEEIVEEEARKLGLDPSLIDARFNEEKVMGSRKNGERYEMYLIKDFMATRPTVRHELYHIYRDCQRWEGCDISNPKHFNFLLHYLFIAEPRAKLYATTGIRL